MLPWRESRRWIFVVFPGDPIKANRNNTCVYDLEYELKKGNIVNAADFADFVHNITGIPPVFEHVANVVETASAL